MRGERSSLRSWGVGLLADEMFPDKTPEDWERLRRWHSLPLEQRKAHAEASLCMLDGDLRPLAAYIRAGWPIDEALASQIADAIDGPDAEGFTLRMIGKPGRRPSFTEREAKRARDFDIALFIRQRQIEHAEEGWAGTFEEIVDEATKKFGVKRSTVTKALADIRALVGDDIWNGARSDKSENSSD